MDTRVVGVLGGGQLGRMMAEAAGPLGVKLCILDPKGTESPAGLLLPEAQCIKGSFKETEAVRKLAAACDIVTTEIEHVNCDALRELEKAGKKVVPSAETIAVVQDKYRQKCLMQQSGIPVAPFREVASPQDICKVADEGFGYPIMLKRKRDAYDGRGNAVVKTAADAESAFAALGGSDLYAEKWVPYACELAVMVAASGDTVRCYPTVETIQRDSICHTVIAPAPCSAEARQEAQTVAAAAVQVLKDSGVFGVELFLLEDGSVLYNEIAPRCHNSGHYTIEGCETSQFENHLRAVLGLPLGSCRMRARTALMVNILGDAEGMDATLATTKRALGVEGATVHWYGKSEARKGRKMAHVTITGESRAQLAERAAQFDVPLATAPVVGVVMGSDSDLPVMQDAVKILEQFGIPHEVSIVSAHRTPERLHFYGKTAADRGLEVIIAGAGGAAHLPGMLAACSLLPVVAVPVQSRALSGVDSLYSIVQMPPGIPVACQSIGGAKNAGLMAARILATTRPAVAAHLAAYRDEAAAVVLDKAERLESMGVDAYLAQKGAPQNRVVM